jgi:hypothetical protein
MSDRTATQTADRPRGRANALPYVFAALPRCACGSAGLKVYRTSRCGDGSVTQYCECGACGKRMKVVWE